MIAITFVITDETSEIRCIGNKSTEKELRYARRLADLVCKDLEEQFGQLLCAGIVHDAEPVDHPGIRI